ncbi:MAG: hypothetical protein QXS24_00915 [Desulfurococcaceae archaeon]
MMHRHYIKFGDKCLEILLEADSFTIRGNVVLEVRQRIITITGNIKTETCSIREGRRKVIYLHYDKTIGSDCTTGYKLLEELSTPLVHIRYTKSTLGEYLTIIPSGLFLVDYIVVSSETTAIIIPGKREVYVDKSNHITTVYIV